MQTRRGKNGKMIKKSDKGPIPNSFSSDLMKTTWGTRVVYGPMTEEMEKSYLSGNEFSKSSRSDYGRKIDISIPQGYHAQAKKSWEMYSTDRFFRYLVDRAIDYGANGFEWELSIEDPSDVILEQPDPTKPSKKKKIPKALKKVEKEKKVWDTWASKINEYTSNVMPGIDEANKWMFKQLLLGGMSPVEWEWGKVVVDGTTYEMPVRITTHNVLSTALERTNDIFMNEKVHIKISSTTKNIKDQDTANQVQGGAVQSVSFNSNDWHTINLLGTPGVSSKKLQGFVIKYNWSPGDNTSTIQGTTIATGQGLYPQPPFYGLDQILVLRRQLNAADIAILDGVINYIVDWSIGDSAQDSDGNFVHDPKPAKYDANGTQIEKSTIETVAEMITADNKANAMQLFHPYYYKLQIIMPDVNLLVSNDKYTHAAVEMYAAFGIFLSIVDRRIDFTNINTANFEQMLDNIRRRHIARFWESLCVEIVRRNGSKLSIIPNMVFNPLNTQDQDFRTGLLNLAKVGKVSMDSLLKSHKLDKKTELVRIAKEVSTGEKDIMDANVPVSFVQSTVNPDGDKTDSSRSSTKDGGRPVGAKDSEPRDDDEEDGEE